MRRITSLVLFALSLTSLARAGTDGAEFRRLLLADLQQGVERAHATAKGGIGVGTTWRLSAMVSLHQQTGDERLLKG